MRRFVAVWAFFSGADAAFSLLFVASGHVAAGLMVASMSFICGALAAAAPWGQP